MLIPAIKNLKLNEILVLSVFVMARFARDLLEAFAEYPWMFYLGKYARLMHCGGTRTRLTHPCQIFSAAAGMLDCCNNLVYSILKAMLAACVPLNEVGQVFSMWSFLDSLLPIGVAQIYNEIWAATQNSMVGAVYIVSAGFTLGAFLIIVFFVVQLRGKSLAEVTGTKQTRKAEQAENKG